jgi:hypothetical protein
MVDNSESKGYTADRGFMKKHTGKKMRKIMRTRIVAITLLLSFDLRSAGREEKADPIRASLRRSTFAFAYMSP